MTACGGCSVASGAPCNNSRARRPPNRRAPVQGVAVAVCLPQPVAFLLLPKLPRVGICMRVHGQRFVKGLVGGGVEEGLSNAHAAVLAACMCILLIAQHRQAASPPPRGQAETHLWACTRMRLAHARPLGWGTVCLGCGKPPGGLTRGWERGRMAVDRRLNLHAAPCMRSGETPNPLIGAPVKYQHAATPPKL